MKFTCLIPTHNNGVIIRTAIESVLEQTVGEFEVFVVCDGAPEQTHALVDEYAERDKRIRAFKFPKGERHGEASRHEALKHANSDAVCYLSDDDFWLPDHLAHMSELLEHADFGHSRHTYLTPNFEICGNPGIDDADRRKQMAETLFNVTGPTCVGHRLDAYRRLPIGWSPAPRDVWTDLNMWRKWIAAEGVRFISSTKTTTIHLPSSLRETQKPDEKLKESAFWRAMFRNDRVRAALHELMPAEGGTIKLADVAAGAEALHLAEYGAVTAKLETCLAERDTLASDRHTWLATRDTIIAERDTFMSERNMLKAERNALAVERERLVAKGDALKADRDTAVAEHDALSAEREEWLAEKEILRAAEAELNAVRNTLTWRSTAPLRALWSRIRGGG